MTKFFWETLHYRVSNFKFTKVSNFAIAHTQAAGYLKHGNLLYLLVCLYVWM